MKQRKLMSFSNKRNKISHQNNIECMIIIHSYKIGTFSKITYQYLDKYIMWKIFLFIGTITFRTVLIDMYLKSSNVFIVINQLTHYFFSINHNFVYEIKKIDESFHLREIKFRIKTI